MGTIEEEIASQPAVWRLAVEAAAQHAADLPASGERIALIGCGTSHYIAQSVATLRESRGFGETDAFTASEFPAGREYVRVLAITRSGTTTEVLDALDRTAIRSLVLTAVADSPAAAAADRAIALGFADEEAVVQTRFATSGFAFLRTWLGFGAEVEEAADAVESGGGEAPDISGFDHFVFLGAGETVGLAREAALKFEESAGVWAEAFPAMEYRHGPISAARPNTLVWPLGSVEPSVLDAAAAAGATVNRAAADPLVDLVAVHRAAVATAVSRGRDPSFPEHLTRSVVLG